MYCCTGTFVVFISPYFNEMGTSRSVPLSHSRTTILYIDCYLRPVPPQKEKKG